MNNFVDIHSNNNTHQ